MFTDQIDSSRRPVNSRRRTKTLEEFLSDRIDAVVNGWLCLTHE
jgi:hypothetical protein